MEEKLKSMSPEIMKEVASVLEDLHMNLEPMRDQAMDQRARWTGFVECAEHMLKVIVNRASALKQMAKNPIEDKKEEVINDEAAASHENTEVCDDEIESQYKSNETNKKKWLDSI